MLSPRSAAASGWSARYTGSGVRYAAGPACSFSELFPDQRLAVPVFTLITGTGPVVAVVVESGIAVIRLTGDAALRRLASVAVTALGLAVRSACSPRSAARAQPAGHGGGLAAGLCDPSRSGRTWLPR